ncbi:MULTISPECIES: hypothetical protein [unclassified Acinetobacter]|jgi:hypothetical protein|uniref:hypothetical protein n=1 Tax=unclassified Acinetobacter TaxID=196816 RepID=UPI000A337DD1|nr:MULTISPECIES: hypothetical protein [unclassified Acinetobacter]OTG59415.1 hypothetical protein B9T36_08625 [Acinetobacter sp. ANC 4204]RGD92561.1 hypothetical protein DYI96_04330 [Acinetobacter sp. SWAC57]
MFKPFIQGAESHAIHDLTLDNDVDCVSIYGNLQLTKDQVGLAAAKALQSYINAIVQQLESEVQLPEKIQRSETGEIDNPFL